MKTKLDCHQLLAGTSTRQGFLGTLDLPKKTKDKLRAAREKIRERVRSELRTIDRVIAKRDLFEAAALAKSAGLQVMQPRFRMQGSMVYFTVNVPAYVPPQYVDLDDGLYMPTSFMSDMRPSLASKGFFLAVETILTPLCRTENWTLDTTKSTCIRILIGDNEGMHIDVPLYAIPDDAFATLTESAAALAADAHTRVDTLSKADAFDSAELFDQVYRSLPGDRIMMAHRDEGWKPSDPRQIEDWFQGAVDDHGPVLRRICRYLKAWRDYQWKDGGPSSIAIMALVVTALDELKGTLPDGRDDVALFQITSRLPALLASAIPCPVEGLPALDKDWSPERKRDMVQRAELLKSAVDEALHGGFLKPAAIARLRTVFGSRIPDEPELIAINDDEAEVLSYEPVRVSSPMVTKTTSG